MMQKRWSKTEKEKKESTFFAVLIQCSPRCRRSPRAVTESGCQRGGHETLQMSEAPIVSCFMSKHYIRSGSFSDNQCVNQTTRR